MSNSQTITQGGFTAIFLHELRMLFFAPLTYLFQGAFLLALGACIFLISSFYTMDEATVRLLLVFIPWVSLVLVPALAMSAWSDGHSNRELELVFALPIRPIYVVLGKFAAGYFLLLLTLAMTFPFCLTVAYLGEPDLGLVFFQLPWVCFVPGDLFCGDIIVGSVPARACWRLYCRFSVFIYFDVVWVGRVWAFSWIVRATGGLGGHYGIQPRDLAQCFG